MWPASARQVVAWDDFTRATSGRAPVDRQFPLRIGSRRFGGVQLLLGPAPRPGLGVGQESLQARITRALDARADVAGDQEGEVVGPFVEALLALRRDVRADKLWVVSDRIRDALVELGVEVRDAHDGSTWSLRG